jgi:hypothetical protein
MIGERRVKVNISFELSSGNVDVNAWGLGWNGINTVPRTNRQREESRLKVRPQ